MAVTGFPALAMLTAILHGTYRYGMGNPVSALAVANTFLDFAKEEDRSVTHMELQKYTFFAHGWYLGNTGEPLIKDQVQAWKFGPVIPRMYHAFKGFGINPVDKYGVEFDWDKAELTVPQIEDTTLRTYLRKIWDMYKRYSAGGLSTISHAPNGPWAKFYREGAGGRFVKNIEIPNTAITEFYRNRLAANR